uniref:Uncharacterized protein n=1 Tax=Panagrolaimus sp. PS1159 TaxID=55785 RepID=A0AC35EWV3_9BILA
MFTITVETDECELLNFAKAVAFVGLVLSTFSLLFTTQILNLLLAIVGIFLIINIMVGIFDLIFLAFYPKRINISIVSNVMLAINIMVLFYTFFAFIVIDKIQRRLIKKPSASTVVTQPSPSQPNITIVNEDTLSKASAPMEED